MANSIKVYARNFVIYNRRNDFGWTLLAIAVAMNILWAILVTATVNMGGPVGFGWWAMLPIFFTLLAVLHLGLRPVIAPAYANK